VLRFADTMVMSTYLVAFVIGPYEISEPDDVDGVPVRIAAPRGRLGLSSFAASAARHSLRFLGEYFEIPYPGGKLDHVAVPDFAFGAMENLGCVTYRDRLLLVDPGNAAQSELQNVAIVIAHETAHMWFGDLVTMKWWNGIWLNEAFATFMELTTTDDFRPEWQAWTAFGAGKAAALAIDGLSTTRPVEYPVGRPEEAEGMFDVLTYQKGGSVLRMLEQFLGPEVFRKGISHYLATHAYGNTETEDLWDALEHVSGQPVRNMMATWIQQGGCPMIHARLGPGGDSVELRQERFLYSPESAIIAGPDTAPATGGRQPVVRWVVPVNLRASVGGQLVSGRLLLEEEGASFSFPGPVDWVVVNEGAWGYYRVRYTEDLLSRLRAADPVVVMSPLERLSLAGDTWAAVVAGQARLDEWAAAAVSVASDPDPDVWSSLAASLRSLTLMAYDRGPEGAEGADGADRRAVQVFAQQLAGPAADAVGWDPGEGEGDRLSIARGRILGALADYGSYEPVIAEARNRYATHLADPAGGTLAPDLVRTAAAISVAYGDADVWHRTLDAYRATDRAVEQLRYLYALAETPIEDLRMRLLEMTIGGEVRSQDGPFIIAAALSRPGAAGPVWDWIEANWARLAERFPPSLAIRMLDAASVICDANLAVRVRRFCEEVDLAVSEVRMQQILERMDLSVALAGRLRGRMAAEMG
jgi:puromycin-sensitive aminopeptidase